MKQSVAKKDFMATACHSAVASGIKSIAFGDLFLEDVRRYREDRLRGTGLDPLFPLWGRNTRDLVCEMIDGGLRARIVCLDPSKMPADFAGRDLDRALLRRLPDTVDPCGENGEFHTFAYAGPMFRDPISIGSGECVTRDGFVFADMNIASTAGFQPGPLMAVYYATKAYVISLSEAIANEVRNTGVTVTCFCPGATDTGFAKRAGNDKTRIFKRAGVMNCRP